MPPKNWAARSGQLCRVSEEADQWFRSTSPVVHSAAGTHANACEEPESVSVKSAAPLRINKGFLRKYQFVSGGRCSPTSRANGGSSLADTTGNPSNGTSPTACPGGTPSESEQSRDTWRAPKLDASALVADARA